MKYAVIFAALMMASTSQAQDRQRFADGNGEAVFRSICQGCHMPDAKGAVGAGAYPALAANANLQAAGYPVSMVVQGRKAMPAFGGMLSDQQVADVVNYVRTHFGNAYTDSVTPDDVKAVRISP